jgi:hypothetical protein
VLAWLALSATGASSTPQGSDITPADKRPLADPETAPTLSHEHLCTILVHVARAYALPIGFFTNLIWQESGFKHRAVSRAGAQGVAQFMPYVADKVGLENPFDAREALPASARLLQTLRTQFGNLGLAAAAYNAGPRRVIEWQANRSQLPKETLDYVLAVTGRPAKSWDRAGPGTVVFHVPPRVPCHRVDVFAQAEQAERAQAEAQAVEEPRAPQQALGARHEVAGGRQITPERARPIRLARKSHKARSADRPRMKSAAEQFPNIQIAVPEEPRKSRSRTARRQQIAAKPRKQQTHSAGIVKKTTPRGPRLSGAVSASGVRKLAKGRASRG